MFQKLADYLKETRLEMKKVNWPTRAETLRYTVTVILV
ncbi:MAG: preprotein translocase subunit SecE, partial [Patescibacteria group bacterium]